MTEIMVSTLLELADVWENHSIETTDPKRAEVLRECVDGLRMLSSVTQQCIDKTLNPTRAPTHRCKVCGAFWMEWSDSWSLCSKQCGKCCDNSPEFINNLVPLITSDIYSRHPTPEQVEIVNNRRLTSLKSLVVGHGQHSRPYADQNGYGKYDELREDVKWVLTELNRLTLVERQFEQLSEQVEGILNCHQFNSETIKSYTGALEQIEKLSRGILGPHGLGDIARKTLRDFEDRLRKDIKENGTPVINSKEELLLQDEVVEDVVNVEKPEPVNIFTQNLWQRLKCGLFHKEHYVLNSHSHGWRFDCSKCNTWGVIED